MNTNMTGSIMGDVVLFAVWRAGGILDETTLRAHLTAKVDEAIAHLQQENLISVRDDELLELSHAGWTLGPATNHGEAELNRP